jgi:hypothetical protein
MSKNLQKFKYGAGAGFTLSNGLGTIVEHLFTNTTLDETKISRPSTAVGSAVGTGSYFLAEDKYVDKNTSLLKKSTSRFLISLAVLTAIYKWSGQSWPDAITNSTKLSGYSVLIAPTAEYFRNLACSFNDVSDKINVPPSLKNLSKSTKKVINYSILASSIVVGVTSYQVKKSLFPDRPGIECIIDKFKNENNEKEVIEFPLNKHFTKPNEDQFKMYLTENKGK